MSDFFEYKITNLVIIIQLQSRYPISDHFTPSYRFDFTNPKKLSQKKENPKMCGKTETLRIFLSFKILNIEHIYAIR